MMMANLDEAIKGLQECDLNGGKIGNCPYKDAISELLKEQEGVVRCKDCRRNHKCAIQSKFAYADDEENWFCAYGKRSVKWE